MVKEKNSLRSGEVDICFQLGLTVKFPSKWAQIIHCLVNASQHKFVSLELHFDNLRIRFSRRLSVYHKCLLPNRF